MVTTEVRDPTPDFGMGVVVCADCGTPVVPMLGPGVHRSVCPRCEPAEAETARGILRDLDGFIPRHDAVMDEDREDLAGGFGEDGPTVNDVNQNEDHRC